ncbi:MAG: rhodanese-like domain-containing protein [Fibrobacterales bacterium]
MKIEQIYTGCLAQAAYYIESKGEVAIIDPLRESELYIQKSQQNNAAIKYVFETHFHADFVTGCVALAEKTGAAIVYGPGATPEYAITVAQDGEEFLLGDITIRAIHTPGHTLESTTYMVIDEAGKEHALFTGDTLFLGDVGRPDLSVKSDKTVEDLASDLYESLYTKIMPLADELIVYPGHGAGSACGKNMSKETIGTLGQQKRENYALAHLSKEDFITQVTTGLTKPPQYFPKNALLNKQGVAESIALSDIPKISASDVEQVLHQESALLIDSRTVAAYGAGHIPKSVNFPLNGQFATWVGTLVPNLNQKIVVVAEPGEEENTLMRLARVGYDTVIGIVEGGFPTWQASGNPVEEIPMVSAEEFAQIATKKPVLDVRNTSEYISQHVDSPLVSNIPLDQLSERMGEVDTDKKIYVHCAGGYRSMIGVSMLKARGYHNLVNVNGGFNGIMAAGVPVTAYVCPSTIV